MRISGYEAAALVVGAIFAAYGFGMVRGWQLSMQMQQEQAQIEETLEYEER